MSTQGILISSDSNIDQHYTTRVRTISVATSLALPLQSIVNQENRNRSATSKSPGKVLKPQVISPRLLVTNPKRGGDNKNPESDKLENLLEGTLRTRTYTPVVNPNRRSVNGYMGSHLLLSPNGYRNSLSASHGAINNITITPINTKIHNLIPNLENNSSKKPNESNNTKPILRSTTTNKSSSHQKTNIKRFTTNPRSLKHSEYCRASQSPTQFRLSPLIPVFPTAPVKPLNFAGGNDRLAYKIWMKERMKYEKWESSKILFDRKLAEGNIGACHKIVQRVNAEIEVLAKAIKEDECRRTFPEEPVKPAEFCPSNVKEAKVWYQQKVMYEAWQNAFALFQENSAKGDIAACKKLVDIIQMTLYNPSYKPDLANSQSTRRYTETSSSLSKSSSNIDGETYIYKPCNVKFTPVSGACSPGSNPAIVTSLSRSTRPKLKPPASWTKQNRSNTNTFEKMEKENRGSNMNTLEKMEKENRGMNMNTLEKEKNCDKGKEVRNTVENTVENTVGNYVTHEGDHQNLLQALDLGLADLNSSLDNYFTQVNQNNE